MAQTVKHDMVVKFAEQMTALLRAQGGLGAFVAILMRVIGKSELPTPGVAADLSGEEQPGKDVEIDDAAFGVIFSEDPKDKSLWWMMNALIAKSSIDQDTRLKHATGDELRIAKAYIETLKDEEQKRALLEKVARLEKNEAKVEFPDIGV